MTPTKLRREILGAMHALTGTTEPERDVWVFIRRYLGPWVGMTSLERWKTMGALELELLANAVLERAAIVTAQADAGKPREVVVCGGRDYQPIAGPAPSPLGWASKRSASLRTGPPTARRRAPSATSPWPSVSPSPSSRSKVGAGRPTW
jgi:hypothetical protein